MVSDTQTCPIFLQLTVSQKQSPAVNHLKAKRDCALQFRITSDTCGCWSLSVFPPRKFNTEQMLDRP